MYASNRRLSINEKEEILSEFTNILRELGECLKNYQGESLEAISYSLSLIYKLLGPYRKHLAHNYVSYIKEVDKIIVMNPEVLSDVRTLIYIYIYI